MNKKPLTVKEKILRVLRRNKKFLSTGMIAQKTGCNRNTVRRCLNELDRIYLLAADGPNTRESFWGRPLLDYTS